VLRSFTSKGSETGTQVASSNGYRADVHDDIGDQLTLTRPPERIVSLVPSLTESIASTSRTLLVGATNWCTHPRDLDVARVRGTKNPDVDAVVALRPDVVIANAEENRDEDIARLREQGVAVWVTAPTTVPEALTSLGRMYDALMIERPGWLGQAEQEWASAPPPPTRHAVVPIWRRPWMALGRDTFAGDVLARLGVRNVLDGDPERYPRIHLDRLPAHDLVVLPDEPYAFDETDGPEAFPTVPSACVSGRHLTWYGPSLVEARRLLTAQLAAARMAR
jgi:ABC-type Fe3+-hydroxamate transport system substrate-binding protein